jgi:hypothetical protein
MPNTTIEPDNIVTPVHTREGDPQFITSDTARGGPRGPRGLAMLLGGFVLIAIAWGLIELFYRHAA